MSNEYFDLSDAVEIVAHRTQLDEEKVRDVLREFFNATAHAVGKEGKAAYKGLGGFTMKERAARKFFLNGQWFEVPAHLDVHFNPHPDFCRWINESIPDKEGLKVLVNQD